MVDALRCRARLLSSLCIQHMGRLACNCAYGAVKLQAKQHIACCKYAYLGLGPRVCMAGRPIVLCCVPAAGFVGVLVWCVLGRLGGSGGIVVAQNCACMLTPTCVLVLTDLPPFL